MSDRTLLPIRRDEHGVDWPYLGDRPPRMIVVDQLLRSGVDVREERPALKPGVLGSFAIGWPPAVVMSLGLALGLIPGVPDPLQAIGWMLFLLVPPALAAIIGYRRARALPPDLRDLARSEVHASSTKISVRPWVARLSLGVLLATVVLLVAAALLDS